MDNKLTLSDLQAEFEKGHGGTITPSYTVAHPPAETPRHAGCATTHSPSIGNLAAALAAAQAELGHAEKKSDNPYFKSKYADLAAVWDAIGDILGNNGIAVIQSPSSSGNTITVDTIMAHKSGEWIKSSLTMICSQTTPQAIGSGLTYARRYALSAMVGVSPANSDDDDGNRASGNDKGEGSHTLNNPATRPYQKVLRKQE